MKALLIVLLFTGQTELRSFEFEPKDWDGLPGFSDEEIVLSCFERAEELMEEIAEHRWDDPKGSGYFLIDGTGTIQGHICQMMNWNGLQKIMTAVALTILLCWLVVGI